MRDAALRLAAFAWPKSWGEKTRYHYFAPAEHLGQSRDVPANIVHRIMCTSAGRAALASKDGDQ